MSKLLALVHKMRKDLNNDWSEELQTFNIEHDIAPLYKTNITTARKNTIFSFIVLAYDNYSEFMEVHKDRMQVKMKILKTLGADLKEELFTNVLSGTHEPTQRVIAWFTVYQRDWRWDAIRANFDYHAEMMMFATQLTPDKLSYDREEKDHEGKPQLITHTEDIDMDKRIANNIKKAECLKKGIEARLEGEKLLKEIETEFVNIDTALHKEGVPRLTKTVDINSHEQFIAKLRHDKLVTS